jgi:hypothetical protein
MADALQFNVSGKKNLLVYRSGPEGTGQELRIAFADTRRRWKCIQIDLASNGHIAKWITIDDSREAAAEWVRFSATFKTDAVSAPRRIHPRGRRSGGLSQRGGF